MESLTNRFWDCMNSRLNTLLGFVFFKNDSWQQKKCVSHYLKCVFGVKLIKIYWKLQLVVELLEFLLCSFGGNM